MLLFMLLLCTKLLSAACESGESSASFIAWLAANGATHPNVGVKDFGEYGKGLLAVQPISHGDMIMDIPAKIILSREFISATRQQVPYMTAEVLAKLQNDEDLLAVVLAREKLKGDASFWKPYLDVLPAYVPQPALFSIIELQELQHPAMQSRISEMQKLLKQRSTAVVQIIQGHGSQVAQNEALDLYHWGISLVQSRALTFRGRKYICPLADMFNYEPRNDRREANAGESFLRYHQLSSEGLQIYADRDCSPGTQLFEDYGDNKDEIYFLYHGFISANNPFRCLGMPLDLGHITGHPDKLRLLRLLGFHSRPNPCIDQNSSDLLAAAAITMTNLLTGYETTDCIDILKSTSMQEQAQIKAFLQSGDCSSQGFKLLTSLSVSRPRHCPVTSALQLHCRGDPDAWSEHARAADLLSEGLSHLRQNLQAEAKSFSTDLETDRSILSEIEENLSRNHLTNAELRRSTNMQLAVRYRMLRKQLWASTLEAIDLIQNPLPSTNLPSLEKRVELLNNWLDSVGCAKKLLRATIDADYRVSAVATKPIRTGELYLSVPVQAIMESAVAGADPQFGPVPAYLQKQFGRQDGYHELLLFLLHEYFVRRTESKWWPYLQMLPTPEEQSNPLLFNQTALESIKPSVLFEQTVSYQRRVSKSFANLQRLRSLPHFLPPHILSFERYQWATAILDSRTIWWNGRRHLVPLLDTVNCKEGPPGAKVHATRLDARQKFAETRAAWDFQEGEQVFENYGQPNHIYFLYHGFVLQENSHDCVLAQIALDEGLLLDYPKIYEENKGLLGMLQYTKGHVTTCLKFPLPIEVIQFMQLKHLLETTKVCDHACAIQDTIATIQQLLARYEEATFSNMTTRPANVAQLHRAEVAHLNSVLSKLQQLRGGSGPFSEL